jgi:hypothetical protein
MTFRPAVLATCAIAAVSLVACGDDSDKKASSSETSKDSAATAITEIAATRAGLDKAAAQVKAGDRAAATETIDETYVTHFEEVEDPLEEVDHALKEELEEGIHDELRAKIKSAPPKEVAALVTELKAGLDTAKKKLEAA